MRVCRVCLATSVKMYHMSEHKLSVMYERVTGVEISTDDKLPKMLCWECVARLSSANNFKDKALKTYWLLVEKFNSTSNVTISDIESMSRSHCIRSTLGCKVIIESDSNFYNLPENDDHFNIENYKYEESCELNDIDNEKEQIIIMEDNVSGEIDPIKTEYFDVTEEQNVSDEDYKKVKFPNTNTVIQIHNEENIKDKVFEVPIDNVKYEEENHMFVEVRDVSEEIKQSRKKIHRKVTQLRKRTRELSQCKELRTQDSFKKITAQSSKISVPADHPQIKQETLEEQDNFLIITTNTEIRDSESNIASASTAAVDGNKSLIPDDTEYSVNMNTKDAVFTCNYCGYESNKKRRLNIHINTMHTKNVSFDCSHCSYKAYDKRTLTRHVNAKHTKTNVYNCSLCSYNSYDKSNLTRHVNNQHTKTKAYSCSYCSFKTFQQSNLKAHVKVKHTKTDVYNCSLCSYEAYDKHTLTKHVNAKHTETDVHNCPYCSFKTYLKGNLNQHINAKHTKTNVYNCDYCDFKTYQRGSLNVHVNAKHTKANAYKCKYCSFITYQHGSLSSHVNAMHVKRKVYNCSLCSYSSLRKSSLTAHVNTKHT